MPDVDQGAKRIVEAYPQDLVTFALPGAEYLGPMPVDVATEPQLVLDTLLRVRYHGVECLVDIELEAYPRKDIGRRCFEYGARANIVYQLPVISVMLWLQRDGRPPESPYQERVGDLDLETWPFIGIELYALDAERALTGDLAGLPGLLPLVPFMRGGEQLATIERAAQLLQERVSDPEHQLIAETLFMVFAARSLGEEDPVALLRRLTMSTELLDQSPIFRRWRAEFTAAGKAEGLLEAAQAALRGRWGELSPEVAGAVEAASAETLLDVVAHVSADTQEQMRARLGL